MKRRDFWKPIVAGALAPAALLAAAKAEPKEEFPRYFVHARRFIHGVAYAEWRSRDELWFIDFDGKRSHRATAYLPPDAPERHTQTWFVNDCLSRKWWREITAAEAKALLKTGDSPRWPPLCDKCVWLGRWRESDLWACLGNEKRADPAGGIGLYARYGADSRYTSWTLYAHNVHTFEQVTARRLPQIGEAYRRAKAKGMMKDWRP